jgi:hypothetical protein
MQKVGKHNPMWKGPKVGYKSLHEYMRVHYIKPELCECCHLKPSLDLANKGTYDRNIQNWEWLCRRCHMVKDGRMNNLWKGIVDRKKWKPPIPKRGASNPNWKGGKPKCKTCGETLSNYAFRQCGNCYAEVLKLKMPTLASYAANIRWGNIAKNKTIK